MSNQENEWQPARIALLEQLQAHPPWPGYSKHEPIVVDRHNKMSGKMILVKPTNEICYCGSLYVDVHPDTAEAILENWGRGGGIPQLCLERILMD